MNTFWPNETQELFLKAALLSDEDALKAWNDWNRRIDLHDIDGGSGRLIPQVYMRMKNLDPSHPYIPKMKGIYRYHWAKNQNLFSGIRPILKLLNEAGIPVLLLKGAALTLSHYHDFGLRPMQDFDILVPKEKALQAIDLFQTNNWHPRYLKFKAVKTFNSTFLNVYSAIGLANDRRQHGECDLHWTVCKGLEEAVWEFAKPLSWEGLSLHIPDPTEQLIHTCTHGAVYNLIPTFRWVSDSMTLLQNPAEIDWKRLIQNAQKYQLIMPMKKTLAYLAATFHAPIPQEVLIELQQIPANAQEIKTYEDNEAAAPPQTRLQYWRKNIRFLWDHHHNENPFFRFITFPRFLQKFWGLNSIFELPFQILRSQFSFWKKNL